MKDFRTKMYIVQVQINSKFDFYDKKYCVKMKIYRFIGSWERQFGFDLYLLAQTIGLHVKKKNIDVGVTT